MVRGERQEWMRGTATQWGGRGRMEDVFIVTV